MSLIAKKLPTPNRKFLVWATAYIEQNITPLPDAVLDLHDIGEHQPHMKNAIYALGENRTYFDTKTGEELADVVELFLHLKFLYRLDHE